MATRKLDEKRVDSLFARFVEHLVVNGSRLSLRELAGGDPELEAALAERIELFEKLDEALGWNADKLSGKTVSHYNILERIGSGGMALVYRAEDLHLRREVAIKVLPPTLAMDPERSRRFAREARILAALEHPNISAIHGVERVDGLRFLVLELLEGETLGARIARGPLALEEALPLFLQIARALEAAHSRGIVHRDLKPANIQITPEGTAKVLDFGLGKTFGGSGKPLTDLAASATRVDAMLGTAPYMSPEQARGQKIDDRTDVWSFGCVLYEALTGRRCFAGETLSDTLVSILEREPDWRALSRGTPRSLKKLLRQCLTIGARATVGGYGTAAKRARAARGRITRSARHPAAKGSAPERCGRRVGTGHDRRHFSVARPRRPRSPSLRNRGFREQGGLCHTLSAG